MFKLKSFALFVTLLSCLISMGCSTPQERIQGDLSQIVFQADFLHNVKGQLPQSCNELKIVDGNGNLLMGFAEPVLDPWGNPYVYQVSEGKPVGICYGKDARKGGLGENQDIALTLKEARKVITDPPAPSSFVPMEQVEVQLNHKS